MMMVAKEKEKMMKIEVLGAGCKKCKQLLENTQQAVQQAGIDAQIDYVTDMVSIAQRGIMSTPALAIGGKTVSTGKVLSPEQVLPYLQA